MSIISIPGKEEKQGRIWTGYFNKIKSREAFGAPGMPFHCGSMKKRSYGSGWKWLSVARSRSPTKEPRLDLMETEGKEPNLGVLRWKPQQLRERGRGDQGGADQGGMTWAWPWAEAERSAHETVQVQYEASLCRAHMLSLPIHGFYILTWDLEGMNHSRKPDGIEVEIGSHLYGFRYSQLPPAIKNYPQKQNFYKLRLTFSGILSTLSSYLLHPSCINHLCVRNRDM